MLLVLMLMMTVIGYRPDRPPELTLMLRAGCADAESLILRSDGVAC
jgi:hypothetical protein